MPNITGWFDPIDLHGLHLYTAFCNGAFSKVSQSHSSLSASVGAAAGIYISFDASDSSSIYGNSNTVQPLSLILNAIIKY